VVNQKRINFDKPNNIEEKSWKKLTKSYLEDSENMDSFNNMDPFMIFIRNVSTFE